MKHFISKAIWLLILCLCMASQSQAQGYGKFRDRLRLNPPKVLLVQIFTYQRMQQHFERTKDTRKLNALVADRDSIRDKMIADFSANFRFCPVYFFYDTDVPKIKNRQFDGVLFDKNLKPVNNIIAQGDTSFFIAYFGNMLSDNEVSGEWYRKDGSELPNVPGNEVYNTHKLVVLNHDYVQLPTYSKINMAESRGARKKKKPYSYESPRLNIYYNASAATLQRKLDAFFNRGERQ